MNEVNGSTIALPESESQDVLTGILRRGARKLLADAIETEVTEWIDAHATVRDAAGRRQVVRNGHLPARSITTGLGPVEVRQPRVRDRRSGADVERFTREIVPLVLNGPPSVTGFAGGRPKVEEIVAYWPALLDKRAVSTAVTIME